MKSKKSPFKYLLFKNRKVLPLIIGFVFVFLALVSTHLVILNRYIPIKGCSSFTPTSPPPQDVEGYFSNLLNEDMASTVSRSGFPSELLFFPDTKKMQKLLPEEAMKRVSLFAENGDWEKCLEAIHSLNIESRYSVAASFARRFADSGNLDMCETFLQECRDGITFKELYDFDIQVVREGNREDWKGSLLKSLQQNLALSRDAEEAKALQYIIKVLFIGRIMEQEAKIEEASSLYENSLKQIEQWASEDLPVSWHYILPAFLHYRLWCTQEKSVNSIEDIEKALAGMRHSVPVNRWTWRYHQAVRRRAQNLMRNKQDNPSN